MESVREMKNKEVTKSCNGRMCDPFKSFGKRCSKLVKEQRVRFYIFRKCVSMLVCWNDSGGDYWKGKIYIFRERERALGRDIILKSVSHYMLFMIMYLCVCNYIIYVSDATEIITQLESISYHLYIKFLRSYNFLLISLMFWIFLFFQLDWLWRR